MFCLVFGAYLHIVYKVRLQNHGNGSYYLLDLLIDFSWLIEKNYHQQKQDIQSFVYTTSLLKNLNNDTSLQSANNMQRNEPSRTSVPYNVTDSP